MICYDFVSTKEMRTSLSSESCISYLELVFCISVVNSNTAQKRHFY